ncbi:hypothetical protein P175DRAFT_0553892 [Aspergillus ochraceoroseus IBT 24754]|uniref:Uncharacterized protein n=1 Tax=Aspergillus ochraceoroseus IBT 24754 TaxID=1392256 RepID=A0A2T5M7W5_9EURO|nr:uncharacterized protein P175DRAFT_0553892 [Aspergillus ochraceoroseus IBT 24754]PTU24606.1 hypothetical protein P175DRAFT_0553892 [Aspergillus ochraceoroseus IBT 24754]
MSVRGAKHAISGNSAGLLHLEAPFTALEPLQVLRWPGLIAGFIWSSRIETFMLVRAIATTLSPLVAAVTDAIGLEWETKPVNWDISMPKASQLWLTSPEGRFPLRKKKWGIFLQAPDGVHRNTVAEPTHCQWRSSKQAKATAFIFHKTGRLPLSIEDSPSLVFRTFKLIACVYCTPTGTVDLLNPRRNDFLIAKLSSRSGQVTLFMQYPEPSLPRRNEVDSLEIAFTTVLASLARQGNFRKEHAAIFVFLKQRNASSNMRNGGGMENSRPNCMYIEVVEGAQSFSTSAAYDLLQYIYAQGSLTCDLFKIGGTLQ